jgi:hypothetical protein
MLGIFSVSKYFFEHSFMVIHIVKKASTHGGAQKKESAPVERGVGSPLEEVLGTSLKSEITILKDQNDDWELAETFFNYIRIGKAYIISDLFNVSFWQQAQQMIATGELPHIYPDTRSCRLNRK